MPSYTQNKTGYLNGAGFLLVVSVLTFAQPGQAASVKESVRQGNRLYQQGQFADSGKMYADALKKEPESDIVNFNAGTAFYKQKRYGEAVDHFQKAILSNDPSLRERAYYNLGNSLYKSGVERENTDINAAITALEGSLKHLASALVLDKKDEDAQYNYDFVSKELERLRKEQQKQQQQSQQDQDGQKDQEQQQDPQSGEGQSGSAGDEKEQQRSGALQSGQQDNSSPSRSGERQEQKPQEKEPSAEESEKQAASGEKLQGEHDQAGEQGQQQRSVQQGTVAQGQELTKSEAERLLQNYQQTEEPQGLLHVFKEKHEAGAVIKDW